MADRDTLLKILDLARWAPSGDNTQPWRFEIVDDSHVAIHGHDTRDWCLYDFEGHASHMAHGALLETLRIAATSFGFEARWRLRAGSLDTAPIYDVELVRSAPQVDPLFDFIERRTVQRRPMRLAPLGREDRAVLADACGPEYQLRFFGDFSDRLQIARLLWDNAYIRLTCPEAYPVHREIIEWGARFSADRIPERAVGVDPLTGRLMRWVLGSWSRVDFFNRFMFGTLAPRVQLDFVPALACASHVLVCPSRRPACLEDHVAAGVAMQRLWLAAESCGFRLQPEMTPVIFRWYARSGAKFTRSSSLGARAEALSERFERIASASRDTPFAFFCRVGRSGEVSARSTRKPVSELMVEVGQGTAA